MIQYFTDSTNDRKGKGMDEQHNLKALTWKKAVNGSKTVLAGTSDGATFHLHSAYNPEKEARDWLSRIDLQPHTAYLVLGFGLGYHVKALAENLPDNCMIYVVEHSKEQSLAQAASQNMPTAHWKDIATSKTVFVYGPDIRSVGTAVSKNMREKRIRRLTVVRHFPTMQIHPEFYRDVETDSVEKARTIFNLDQEFSHAAVASYYENTWRNLPRICTEPGIPVLKDALADVPAIVVSSGPSLNKNVRKLKEYKERAIIIACGSAVGALLSHGITPHFLVLIDPFPVVYDLMKDDLPKLSEVAMVAPYVTPHQLVSEYLGPRFFYLLTANTPDGIMGNVAPLLPECDTLLHNISVSTAAVSLAQYMGSKTIILVGQDMAFAGDSSHAEGTRAITIDTQASEECYVEGWKGEKLRTMPAFKDLRDYYSSLFGVAIGYTFINATEGGAFIPNALHMSLDEAGNSYLQQEQSIWPMIIDAKKKFEYPDAKIIIEICERIIGQLSDLRNIAVHFMNDLGNRGADVEVGDEENVKRCVDEFDIYFQKEVRLSPVYTYIRQWIDPSFELLTYQLNEGMHVVHQFRAYWQIGKTLVTGIEKLRQDMEIAVEELRSQGGNAGVGRSE